MFYNFYASGSLLQRQGYEVYSIRDGSQALDLLAIQTIDLIRQSERSGRLSDQAADHRGFAGGDEG